MGNSLPMNQSTPKEEPRYNCHYSFMEQVEVKHFVLYISALTTTSVLRFFKLCPHTQSVLTIWTINVTTTSIEEKF